MNKPYILILDSGGAGYILKRVLKEYDPENFMLHIHKELFDSQTWSIWGDVLIGRYGLSVAIKTEHNATLHRIAPALEEIAAKGYPPVAVIGCPFFTRALFAEIPRSIAPHLKNLTELGFSGEVTLTLTNDELSYRVELPDLFAQPYVKSAIPLASDYDDVEQWLRNAIENAGILPKVPTNLQETKASAHLPASQLAVNQ